MKNVSITKSVKLALFSLTFWGALCGAFGIYQLWSKEQGLNWMGWTYVGFCAGIFAYGFVISELVSRLVNKKIQGIAGDIESEVKGINSVLNQLVGTAQELSSTTSMQSNSLQKTASAIEEITSMVSKTSDSAVQSEKVSAESSSTAKHGSEVVSEMLGAMEQIHVSNKMIFDAIEESNKSIGEIVGVIQEIGTKTNVINDIVFQTKLLSFNASVEAARAGEHGKGFAVVAEEVGNLAALSGRSANEISGLLKGSIDKVETIVGQSTTKIKSLMENAQQSIQLGVKIANECGEVLSKIVNQSSEVSEMATSISHATQEQSAGVKEISNAVRQLEESTIKGAEEAKVCAEASEQLSRQTSGIENALVSLNKLMGLNTSDSRMEWKPEYALDIPSVDTQHKNIVTHINQLVTAVDHGKDIKTALNELAAVTISHFKDEEKFMDSIRYSDLKSHKVIHEKLLAQVTEFVEKVNSGQKIDEKALIAFLKEWLVTHILGTDSRYAKHYKETGRAASIAA